MNKIPRYILAAIVTAIVVFAVWYFGDVVVYILASVVFSLIGKPFVDLLTRIKIRGVGFPKYLAAATTVVILWGIVIASVWIFVPIVVEKINTLSGYDYNHLTGLVQEPIMRFENFIHDKLAINLTSGGASIIDMFHEKLAAIVSFSATSIDLFIEKITSIAVAAFSITFITFFFLKESDLFNEGVVLLFPKRYEDNIVRGLNSSIMLLSRYFIGLFIESLIKLVVIALSFYLIGLSFSDALIIALISAILNVIPYIGPLLGGVIGIIIGISSPIVGVDIESLVFQMILIFTIFQIIDNIILQPYVYSSSVKAHPLEIFIVILLAGSIAGVMGMLLAIPTYTIIRVFAKEFFNNLRLVQKLTEKI